MTIGASLKEFSETKKSKDLVRTIIKILRQKRLLESVYCTYNLIFHEPSGIIQNTDRDLDVGNPFLTHRAISSDFAVLEFLGLLEDSYKVRVRGKSLVADIGEYIVAGEYANYGKRLFVFEKDTKHIHISNFYYKFKGVRHIHLVHHYFKNQLYVATGDSSKYLDLFELVDGCMVFKRREKYLFGGFTASCKVGSFHYFGTDFSLRPNYIYRLNDGAIFFLPPKCYLKIVYAMRVINEKFIVGYCEDLWHKDERGCFVFDAERECFVFDTIFSKGPT